MLLVTNECTDLADNSKLSKGTKAIVDPSIISPVNQADVFISIENPAECGLSNVVITPLPEFCLNVFGVFGTEIGGRPSSNNQVCSEGITGTNEKLDVPERYTLEYDLDFDTDHNEGETNILTLSKDGYSPV